jgi:DNA-binding beta-propeller fold protein YncE
MRRRALSIAVSALLLTAPASLALAGVTAAFRYPLSNFSGPVPSQWAQLAIDPERNEIYTLHRRKNDIRIFDEHGMEIFVFGEGFPTATDIAIGDDGNIFLLTTGYQSATLQLLNYRGDHVSEIPLENIPAAYSGFVADQMVYRHRSLYLVDSEALIVIVVDARGFFKEAHDLNVALRPALPRDDRAPGKLENVDRAEQKLEFIDLGGFTVDGRGNMLFTVPVLFAAFRLSPDGELQQFGRAGSGPGKFGVAAGIVTDDTGYVYVADRLRSVVLIFDPELRFRGEFGYRGNRPSNLIVPDDLAIDRSGNVYVGQAANRGVSVFRVVHEESSSSINREEVGPSRGSEELRPSRGSEATSAVSEKPDRPIEAYVPDRAEFIVDPGADAASATTEESGRTVEGNGSAQPEDNEDEER